jgi:hypothetical protein
LKKIDSFCFTISKGLSILLVDFANSGIKHTSKIENNNIKFKKVFMSKSKLTAEQQQHINNNIRAHKVEFLTYNGNHLGWHHYIEFPSDLFPVFNKEFMSEIWEQIRTYTDDEIKSIQCVYVHYEHRLVWVDLISHSGKRIVPICPVSLLDNIYKDAEKTAQCINLLCEAAYKYSLKEATKYCEEEWITCGEEELSKLVPYNDWRTSLIKTVIGIISPSNHLDRDEWLTEPPLSHHVNQVSIHSNIESDFPF